MKKTDGYYKLIVPARLICKGISPTKENIEAEIKKLKEQDNEEK